MKWKRITSEEAINTLGVNAKPHLIKRLFAGLMDVVILFFSIFLLYSLVMITPISKAMNSCQSKIVTLQEEYKVEAGYANKEIVEKTYDGKNILHYDEVNEVYYIVTEKDFGDDTEAKQTAYNAYTAKLKESEYYSDLTFQYHLHNYVITIGLCGGVLEFLFFFIIPMIKNCGQTLGMFVMSIRLYNPRYVGKPRWYQYLGRFAFIFFIMTALPYIFLAEWTILVSVGINLLIILLNKKNRGLPELVSGVSFVEKLTFRDLDEEEPVAEKETDETKEEPIEGVVKETNVVENNNE